MNAGLAVMDAQVNEDDLGDIPDDSDKKLIINQKHSALVDTLEKLANEQIPILQQLWELRKNENEKEAHLANAQIELWSKFQTSVKEVVTSAQALSDKI